MQLTDLADLDHAAAPDGMNFPAFGAVRPLLYTLVYLVVPAPAPQAVHGAASSL
jgi:hypothetical protein